MDYTRRNLAAVLPLFLAAKAESESTALTSKGYPFDKLPLKTGKNGNQTRAVLDGVTHEGCPIELHITNLPPGGAPHPPHHHVHEEMILVQEGTMEVTIEGNKSKLGPGSVAFVHSNEEHGWKNVGDTRAQYFVLAIGKKNT
jgi:mannose-6-phosphate isomerase-like protein (cupin superfamily)